jgi:hypothetical protein
MSGKNNQPLALQWVTDHLTAGDDALQQATRNEIGNRHDAANAWTNIAREHYRAAALAAQRRAGTELI